MVKGFGTKWINEPTQLCDLLNTIRSMPKALRPKVVTDVENFILKINPDVYECQRHKEVYASFISEDEFLKDPDFIHWLQIVHFNLNDAIVDLKSTVKGICKEETAPVIDQLEKFLNTIRQYNLPDEELHQINQSIKREKRNEWIEENAWDLTEEELKKIETPYDK